MGEVSICPLFINKPGPCPPTRTGPGGPRGKKRLRHLRPHQNRSCTYVIPWPCGMPLPNIMVENDL